MMKNISGKVFRKMILNGAKLIDVNKEHVDALNVFPVPDGDTGTNMSLTMLSAAKEVAACQSNNLNDLSYQNSDKRQYISGDESFTQID